MSDRHETTADIIAEMRGMGNYQRYSGDHARVLANRLEAAHKRERGDAAKLREAVKCLMDNLNIHLVNPSEQITVNRAELYGMVMVCEKALAAPPRNCDVGTPEEQTKRKFEFCQKQRGCGNCPFDKGPDITSCVLAWAQMPYEGGDK